MLIFLGINLLWAQIRSDCGLLAAIRDLRKARRWEGLEVSGGPEGVEATHTSRLQNVWLYDLWLIERILAGMKTN